jgi:hypothetical protein
MYQPTVAMTRTIKFSHLFALALCIASCALMSAAAWADQVHTPAAGSAERKAIMNAARTPVQQRVGQRVIFVVNHLRVQNGWAFFAGSARTPANKPLSQKYLWGETRALLRKSNGAWKVLYWGFATDTGVMERAKKKYPQAPRAIFPY